MKSERIQELRRLAEAATPRPWRIEPLWYEHRAGYPACAETCGKGQKPLHVSTESDGKGELHAHEFSVADVRSESDDEHVVCFGHGYDDYGYVSVTDAAYIVAAANAIPELLDELEAAREAMPEWVCEAHPWLAWPHGECPGPGMPPSNIEVIAMRADSLAAQVARYREELMFIAERGKSQWGCVHISNAALAAVDVDVQEATKQTG